ncbi:MAG: hypothetical protein M1817_005517 [Caeruleum heppii]|nr:MAG: hypothetical protein M1817_005517 [Caeruleum heppii]
MSPSHAALGNTSPDNPVTTSASSSKPRPHVARPSPSPGAPNTVTTPFEPLALGRSRTFPTPLPSVPWTEHAPQLSERDSIFATHYIPTGSEPTTPHRLSSLEGKDDEPKPEDSQGGLTMETPFPQTNHASDALPHFDKTRSSPSLPSMSPFLSGKTGYTEPINPAAAALNGHRDFLNALSQARAKSSDTNRDEGYASVLPPFISPVDTPRERPSTPQPQETPRARYTRPTSEEKDLRRTASTHGGRPDRVIRDRDGRSHADVAVGHSLSSDSKIAATLANAEINARSRKTSHSLGLFKENAGAQESHRRQSKDRRSNERQTKAREDIRIHRDSVTSVSSAGEGGHRDSAPAVQDAATRSWPRAELLKHTLDQERENGHEPPAAGDARWQQSTTALKAPTEVAEAHGPRPRTTLETAPATEQTGSRPQRPKASSHPFPYRLLEEIRNHHNVTPGAARGTSFSTSIPTTIAEQAASSESGPSDNAAEKHQSVAQHQLIRRLKAEADEDEDDDESDKDEISSALYFPHQTPSSAAGVEATEEEEDVVDEVAETRPRKLSYKEPRAAPQLPHDSGLTSLPEEIDISLQSAEENSYLHGETRSSKTPLSDHEEWTPGSLSATDPSSASESEYESWDETGALADGASRDVDDIDTTPTATPVARAPIASRKARRAPRVRAAPIGAVELKPYSHQVGGHTTVFRFSRRAVCKSLSNRENEFYETVERRHPELLNFLPRYIGVLNVTFRKALKKKKAKQEGESIAPQGHDGSTDMFSSKPAASHSGFSSVGPHPTETSRMAPTDQPRIVSQSQQVGPVPQVIFANNRHIIPDSLFRLSSTDLDPRLSSSLNGDSTSQTKASAIVPTRRDWSSSSGARHAHGHLRPPLNKHYSSWGATTVNRKLQEQVLREVFGPPIIHHHRNPRDHHGSANMRASTGSQLQSNRPEGMLRPRRGSEDFMSHHRSAVDVVPRRGREAKGGNSSEASSAKQATTATDGKDSDNLESSRRDGGRHDETEPSAAPPIRRRHSGSSLLRSQSDREAQHRLENDDEGYGGDKEDDFFPMDAEPDRQSDVANPEIDRSGSAKVEGPRLTPAAEVNAQLVSTSDHVLGNSELGPSQPDERVEQFLLLEDLTAGMDHPCVLDLKMGTRQYGLDANEKKQQSQRRKCRLTTSRQLGVRVCGMQVWNVKKQAYLFEDKYFGRDLQAGREFQDALTRFLYDGVSYASVTRRIPGILEELSKLENIIRKLPGYRFYASSLLMLYDGGPTEEHLTESVTDTESSGKGGRRGPTRSPIDVKIVDFANCVTAEDFVPGIARCPPRDAKGVDRGYLRGLRTLRLYFQRIWNEINEAQWVERGEAEGMARTHIGAGHGATIGGWSDSVMDEDADDVSE